MRSQTQKAEPQATAASAPSQRQGESVHLEDLLRFLRRNALLIMGAALVAAVGSAVYLFTQKPVYLATAVLAIRTEGAKRSARSLLMPAQGYLRLVRSRPTLMIARQLLRNQGDGEVGAELSLASLAVRLVQGERWERNNVDLLEIDGSGATSEVAVKTANAWTEACLLLDQAQVRDAALQDVQAEVRDLIGQVEEKKLVLAGELAIVRRQLSATPAFLPVEAILSTPETLVSAAQGKPPAKLISQQPHPLHHKLASQVAQIESSLATAEQKLERLRFDLTFVRRKLREWERRPGEVGGGSDGATGLGADEMEQQAVPEELGINVKRALSAPGALQLLQPAVEARRLESGRGKALKILAAALGGIILGFLVAAGREVLGPATGS